MKIKKSVAKPEGSELREKVSPERLAGRSPSSRACKPRRRRWRAAPSVTEASANPRRYLVIVDGERCKGCELCIQVCRSGAIGVATSLNSKGYHAVRVAAGKKCSGCALCALMCPEAAIEIAVEEGA